jgi:hypothetical protein
MRNRASTVLPPSRTLPLLSAVLESGIIAFHAPHPDVGLRSDSLASPIIG